MLCYVNHIIICYSYNNLYIINLIIFHFFERSDIHNFLESSYTLGRQPSNATIDPFTVDKLENQATKEVLIVMKDKILQFLMKNKESFIADESLTTSLLEGETFLLGENLVSLLNIGMYMFN